MKAGCLHICVLMLLALAMQSCQKEVNGGFEDGITPPAEQKPKVGTTWIYQYYWNNGPGFPTHAKIITHKAQSEVELGGEKWLKIVDLETDTTVYFLNTKADGLYQYTNSTPYLLCKYPAVVNDSYATFNEGANEVFTVKSVNDSTPTGLGVIPLSRYEGVKNTYLIDILWYNKNAWIAWKNQYLLIPVAPAPIYFLRSRMFIESIVY